MEKAQDFFYAAPMDDPRMRRKRGPFPLPVHMGMAASNLSGAAEYAARYQETLSEVDLVSMVRGIQMYQQHPYEPVQEGLTTVWEYDTCRIVNSEDASNASGGRALLLIPSLVNTASILDLMPERSFLRWMNAQGRATYLLDWGDLTQSTEAVDMDSVIRTRLVRAIECISEREGGEVDLLGYCMGGTLSLAAALFCAPSVGRIVLLATPWDFHAGHPALSERVRMWAPMVLPVIEQKNALPAEWTQALFASLDAQDAVQKFSSFASMDQDTQKARLFVAVEDWLNDGRDLPADVARHCIQEWFAKNAPAKGQWVVAGERIDTANIEKDVLVVASDRDRLVPYASAVKVMDVLTGANVQMLRKSCGHVGFVAGRDAVSSVWKPIDEWLLRK